MFRPFHILAGLFGAALLCLNVSSAHASTWPQAPGPEPAPQGGWFGYSWFAANGLRLPVDELPLRLVFLGDPPPGVSLEVVEQAAQNAAQTWTSVPCSSAQVIYAGRRDTLEDLGPGEVPFLFTPPGLSNCLPPGLVGFTKQACAGGHPMRSIFLNETEFDWSPEPRPFQPLYTDPQGDYRLTVDVESVLTHELGHALGLAHSDDPLATMAPNYRGDGSMHTLAVDDKLGLCSLYEVASPPDECSSGRDCTLDHRCDLVDNLWLCREPRGEVGDACALDRLVCEEACVLAEDPGDFGYCTVTCEEGDDEGAGACPDGYRCVSGFLEADQAHCERLVQPDEPTCSSTGGHRRLPLSGLAWLAAAGLLAARQRTIRRRVR